MRGAPADVSALSLAALDLDGETAEAILERELRHTGVIATWESWIRPAFAAIQARHATSGQCVAVEHFLSATVVRSLHRSLSALPRFPATVILACTEREAHYLPLEALRAAMGEYGRPVLMLGADVPQRALTDALLRRPRPITTVLWSQVPETANLGTLDAAVKSGAFVVLAGPGWSTIEPPAEVARVNSLQTRCSG
jgi:MerR family transcriptional regulator, light-induced transcriptional regulator